jgi:hypothetical protein
LVLRQRRLEELDLEFLDVAAVVDEDVERGRLREGGRAVGERVGSREGHLDVAADLEHVARVVQVALRLHATQRTHGAW